MRNSFLLALISLISSGVGVASMAVDVPPVDIDFYKLYNNPEPSISLKDRRTTLDRIAAHGYPVEHHHIVTEDNYVVGAFRIPYSHKLQNEDKPRPIVVIQHGLMSSSDAWILCGPNDGLPYLLADAGFDVWLGNGRGNIYSRNHTTISAENPHFWRFSWHEIGYYDIAAVIDYALKTNGQGQESLHYVGHSQGTTAFLILTSLRPEYNKKIKAAQLFAPVAYMSNLSNSLMLALAPSLGHRNIYSILFADQEFLPYNSFFLALTSNMCELNDGLRPVCFNYIENLISGSRVNVTSLPEGLATHPAGCSTNQVLHYLQEQQSGHFRQYDYGKKKNLKMYNSEQPPDYPVENISSEVHLWYGSSDTIAAVEDVIALSKRLRNMEPHLIDDPLWNHFDFAINKEIREQLNAPVIEIMKSVEKGNPTI